MTFRLNDRQAYVTWALPTGRVIDIVPLTFGRARMLLSARLDDLGALDGW